MKRSALPFAFLLLTMLTPSARSADSKETFVIVHGAWGGGWAFREVDSLLTAKGHKVFRPTLSGQGEKVHLAHPGINLTTHITDIVNVITWEDLHEVVLVGHSYGGMVITGVADRIPQRIKRVVYLDAFVPENGDSVETLRPENDPRFKSVNGFIPTWPGAAEKPIPHDVPHPAATFSEPIALKNQAAAAKLPTTYILFTADPAQPEKAGFFDDYQRAKARGWTTLLLASDHNAQWSHPKELTGLLVK